MKYCKKCVMPDTRPGMKFNEEGICGGCLVAEKKELIDWDDRFKQLGQLCDKYRGVNGEEADCIVPVSGGKDSHYQVYIMKEKMGMHPLLVKVEDNFRATEAGNYNLKNISEAFGCDIISLKPNIRAQKNLTRKMFESHGMPTWSIDRAIYSFPIYLGIKLGIQLIVYGENTAYEYGDSEIETCGYIRICE